MRELPRRTLGFKASQMGGQAVRSSTELSGWSHKRFLVADHLRYVRLTATGAPFTASFTVDDVPPWLVTGRFVVLQSEHAVAEQRLVIEIAANVITMEANSGTTWPIGTLMRPAAMGRVMDGGFTFVTSRVGERQTEFQIDPGTEPARVIPAWTPLYRGHKVLAYRPDYGSPPTITHGRTLDILDMERGPVQVSSAVPFSQETISWAFLQFTRAELDRIVDLFHLCKGRQGVFYAPSWVDELTPAVPLAGGETQYTVAGRALADLFPDNVETQHAVFLKVDGSMVFRQVEQITLLGSNSRVVLATALPGDLNSSNLACVSWLKAYRFASDIMQVEWITSEVGRIQVTAQLLPDPEAI